MHIYKQGFLSVRHFFHVELPGSSFPFPSSIPGLIGMKAFLPFIYVLIYFFLYDALFQLLWFVKLWLYYKSQFRDVLQLKLVLFESLYFLYNRSGRW